MRIRLRRKQRIVGMAFSGLGLAFLVAGYYTNYIVLEVDSIVSFIASIFLLLSSTSVRNRDLVANAVIRSSSKTISDLEQSSMHSMKYVREGENISDIYVVPQGVNCISAKITPPGIDLARLFQREAGEGRLSYDILESKFDVIMYSLALCESAKIERKNGIVTATLLSPSFKCSCAESHQPNSAGCPVSSMIAVLLCATGPREVEILECRRDEERVMRVFLEARE